MAETISESTPMRFRLFLALLVAVALPCLLWASAAGAYTGINEFTMTTSTTQAGGHPDVDVHMNFNDRAIQENQNVPPSPEDECDCEDVEQIDTHFPTGFIGNPHAVGTCTLDQLSNKTCPSDAQVGIMVVNKSVQAPLYNLEPHPEEPGLLGFNIPFLEAPAFISLHGRTGSDFGLDSTTLGIIHTLPLFDLGVHLWGVPGDPIHNNNRMPSPQQPCGAQYPLPCPGAPTAYNGTPAPYLENPTSCGQPLTGGLDLTYYDRTFLSAEASYPATTGCDLLSFNPSMTVAPTTSEADTASGLDLDLSVPQTQSPTVPSPSEIRATKVVLPPGFSINANGGDGKEVCTESQAALGTELAAKCPENAKVGTVLLNSSALPGPITGGMYLGKQESENRFPVILTADGFSTHVKLQGTVTADPVSGRLTTTFDDLPQSPFQEFDVHIFGSERGVLATPTRCGDYEVESEFVPWDSVLPNQTSISHFTIDSGPNGTPCPGATRPFTPVVQAGGTDNTAGKFNPFSVSLNRPDGDQSLTAVKVTTPPGFLASLQGVKYCPDSALAAAANGYKGLAEIAVPSCPIASQIGTAVAAGGAGSRPLYAPAKVYFAGPYKGAPFSLAVIAPAVAGPFDFGNIVVRSAIDIDPLTTQVTTTSDLLPLIFGGVPLRTRFVRIDLDRPGFTLNPTNCDPFSVDVTTFGDEGAVSSQQKHFQVANCAGLPFAPRLSLRMSGGLNRLGHPGIHAVLTKESGEANPRFISVTLPQGEQLDNSHIGTVCTHPRFASNTCPASSKIGEAVVDTPLLENPLSGPVYLRVSKHKLPDMVLDLGGQFDLELVGRVDAVNGKLRARFEQVPDAPFSVVTLDLAGGARGLVVNSTGLCDEKRQATVRMAGQNGASLSSRVRLRADCRTGARHRRDHHSTKKRG